MGPGNSKKAVSESYPCELDHCQCCHHSLTGYRTEAPIQNCSGSCHCCYTPAANAKGFSQGKAFWKQPLSTSDVYLKLHIKNCRWEQEIMHSIAQKHRKHKLTASTTFQNTEWKNFSSETVRLHFHSSQRNICILNHQPVLLRGTLSSYSLTTQKYSNSPEGKLEEMFRSVLQC